MTRRAWLKAVAVAIAFSAHLTPARADTAVLAPVADNTIYYDPSGATSNGAGDYLFIGLTHGYSQRRALVRYDVAGNIPAGSVIEDVEFGFAVNRSAPGSGTESFSLHRVLADWGEGGSDAGSPGGEGTQADTSDATWLYRFYPDIPWSTPGGDFDPTPSRVANVSTGGGQTWTSSPEMVADVQSWLDAPQTNFGWMLRHATEEIRSTARRIASREGGAGPTITVTYAPAATGVHGEDPEGAVEQTSWGELKTRKIGDDGPRRATRSP